MANTELAKCLRDLHLRIQTGSRKERAEIADSIIGVLDHPEINESIVRGLSKIILVTLQRYSDPTSQAYIRRLIKALVLTHGPWIQKYLGESLQEFASKHKILAPTKNTGKTALLCLTWTCLLLQNPSKDHVEEIIETQALLFFAISAADDKKQKFKANRQLVSLWSSHNELWDSIFKTIGKSDITDHGLIYGSFFVQFMHERGDTEKVAAFKTKLIDGLVKLVITCKKKPSQFVLKSCSGLLMLINHEEFSTIFLPALQKAMLRAPEIILQGVSILLSALNLDLSQYANDLGKLIIGNLYSKDDLSRNEAVEACGNLAKQCTQFEALKGLVDHVFGVFQGSQEKITVAQHKISVLQGAGQLSDNKASGDAVQNLSQLAVDHLIKILENEVHEKTLIVALEVLGRWAVKFNSIPVNLINWFNKGMGLKTTTSAVRIAYVSAMSRTFLSPSKPSTWQQTVSVLPAVDALLDKAGAGGGMAGQQEALVAACLLLKLESFVKSAAVNQSVLAASAATFARLWTIVGDANRMGCFSERFLAAATDDDLLKVMELCDTLLVDHIHKVSSKLSPILRALLHCLTCTHPNVRGQARNVIKRIIAALEGTFIAMSFIEEFPNFISTLENVGDDNKTDREINCHVLADAFLCVCSPSNLLEEDSRKIALASMICAHHPLLRKHSKNLWQTILKRLSVDCKHLVELHKSDIVRTVIEDFTVDESLRGTLETLVRVDALSLVPPVVEVATQRLRETASIRVSRDDYFTYLTPEGELYDKTVMPGKEQENLAISNMKRESKVYSYKEQMEELQLRRELEEKRKREGKIKEPELTPKQKELIRLQLEKESVIRTHLQALYGKVKSSAALLESTAMGDPQKISCYFKCILPVLLDNLHSPVAAPIVSDLFITLRKAVFVNDRSIFGEKIAQVTLRILKPACDLSPNWQSEMLNPAIGRILNDLVLFSTMGPLTGPAFCYCFPFLKVVLLDRIDDDDVVTKGLNVLMTHVKIRARNEEDLVHPKLLPRQQLLILLINLIELTGKRVQQLACDCLLELCKTAGDDKGTHPAEADEIHALLTSLQNASSLVREFGLRGLREMLTSLPSAKKDQDLRMRIAWRVWVARNDISAEVAQTAKQLWDEAKLECKHEYLNQALLEDIVHPVEVIQIAAATAMAALITDAKGKKLLGPLLEHLQRIYNEHLEMSPPKLDNLGRVTEQPIDTWEPRRGVAYAFEHLATFLTSDFVSKLVTFFVTTGLADRREEVRKRMLQAALTMVDIHGKDTVGSLLPAFEDFLDKAPDSGSYDAVRQSVVILMGSLARHLDKDDPKIKPIVDRLIEVLSTPSQQVQEAVANCLPPLVPAIKEDAPEMVRKLLSQLLDGETYGERKGAAYGLAGLVKGMGILALKQLNIMDTLTTALQDKKNYRHREGALFAFEMLCNMLGRLFEPYIVHALPLLLLCFGHSSQYVRDATEDTSRVIMTKLSAHGVKLVLPCLLNALEDDSWRTKTGSIEWLGAMAYCAPQQLSSCLPSIVPKLIEVLSDSHVKVQQAGAQALKLIGSVIRNPEIQAIVPVLLSALQDPAGKTATSLQTLLDTKFVHFIDAPSLALIMPVVQRAFMDRSTETRKMAAQIIGNMYSLTDQKDLSPYLPSIIPGLKTSLLDPVPEVRSVSARALGAMVRGMGENSFDGLLPWLMQTLASESSSVDRSGAAQGLSEVFGGLGVQQLHKYMPEIIATAERTDIAPHVKDGYIMMFIYMPVVFTTEFTPYIGQIINPILKALADENEYVRDTALKAGQRIVTLYADSAIMLLLPQLEQGLFDDNWRIRYSSVQLLGDLLYRISGVSGKMSTETADEDDNFGTEQSHTAIIDALGAERRNRVLAGLYMGRSDVALMVRQAALHVWKVVVTNTPRTLREILPTLFGLLLGCLASTSLDKRQVAARTLGDLVRKLGERVLPEIIPILERGLESDAADQRQGVCIGLSEIMASTSRDMVLTFVNSLVPTVRRALCDPLPEVRQAAAKTFDSLHATVGVRALDDILPAMLNQLNSEDHLLAESTLDGLRQVMAIKSRVVLPYLVPQLTAPPVNTKALSILASVAGEALTKYLHKILPALLTALSAAQGTPRQQEELEYCQAVVLSVTDEAGMRTIMDQLMENTKSDKVELRKSAAMLLCAFCGTTRADYSQYVPQLIRGLIHLLTDKDQDVLQVSWEALSAVTKSIDPSQLSVYVSDVRQAVRFAVMDLKGQELLPGFCLSKGITPILPIFREGILTGLPEVKEQAAQGLGEVIKLTSAQALQPSVVQITGPLIRIVGDRFNWTVKAAVLETLALLLAKVGVMVKQFLPQLQTTFVKALNDSNRTVRLKAANALGYLIVIHAKADPIFQELLQGVRNIDDLSIKETMLQALRGVITPAGDKMSSMHRKQIHATLTSLLNQQEDSTRLAVAGCLGALVKYLPLDLLASTVYDHLLNDSPSMEWTLRHGRSSALYVVLKESPETIYVKEWQDKLVKVLLAQLAADRAPIAMNAIRSCGYLFQYLMANQIPLPENLLTPFIRSMNHPNNEVKQLLGRVCTYLTRALPGDKLSPEFLRPVLPMLVNGTKEKHSYVKANSELALVAVLGLRRTSADDTDDGTDQAARCLALLDCGAREALADVITKVLKKVALLPEGKEEELDETILT